MDNGGTTAGAPAEEGDHRKNLRPSNGWPGMKNSRKLIGLQLMVRALTKEGRDKRGDRGEGRKPKKPASGEYVPATSLQPPAGSFGEKKAKAKKSQTGGACQDKARKPTSVEEVRGIASKKIGRNLQNHEATTGDCESQGGGKPGNVKGRE